MYDEYGERGYVPLAVNLWQDMNSVVKVYARYYSYPFLRDAGSAWNAYRMNGYIPLNYVIDTAGIVVGSMEGFNESVIRSWIEPYLTGVTEKQNAPLPEFTAVLPNPAHNAQKIQFQLPASDMITIRIYSASGELVRTVLRGSLAAGTHSLTWNLTDDYGRSVSNGLYFYELSTARTTTRLKTTVLR